MKNKAIKKEELLSIVVRTRRVTKVVEGGRIFSFTVSVVMGDKNGHIGYGYGKALEISDARRKAENQASKALAKIALYHKRTIHHDVYGRYGASKVLLRKAKLGTGIIAGGAIRPMFELLGIKDIVAKSFGPSNPDNLIKAALNALQNINTPKYVAYKRSKTLSQILGGNRPNQLSIDVEGESSISS